MSDKKKVKAEGVNQSRRGCTYNTAKKQLDALKASIEAGHREEVITLLRDAHGITAAAVEQLVPSADGAGAAGAAASDTVRAQYGVTS